MKLASSNSQAAGVLSAAGSYILWGILPVYWKLIGQVPAPEILAHRILWSLFFVVLIVVVTKRTKRVLTDWRAVMSQPKRRLTLIMASILVSLNWLTYIWAVNNNRILETSLGYYINPLFSVLLGIIVLKEKLSWWQSVSLGLATIGVLNMSLHLGGIPWIALALASTFGLYGLCKKIVNVGALTSIAIETLLVAPLSLAYISYLQNAGVSSFTGSDFAVTILLMGAGAVTATPLILFAFGANKLPLSMLGFLQFLSPTIALLIGVFVYHEPFTSVHLVSFGFIWLALAIFSLARTRPMQQMEATLRKTLINTGEDA